MITLAYEEAIDIDNEPKAEQEQFVNVYLVLTGILGEKDFEAHGARLTINIWTVSSSDRTKRCYQWRLADSDLDGLIDEIGAEVITESQTDTVTGIQPLHTLNRDLPDYSRLYRYCLDHLLKRLNLRSQDILYKDYHLGA
jgi:hypothetical protein